MVNCIECFTQRSLFESILEKLSGFVRKPEAKFQSLTRLLSSYTFVIKLRCDNAAEFVDLLMQLKTTEDETMYIVINIYVFHVLILYRLLIKQRD